jgi:RimJ/RimL family protein N-acetyltransferase
VRFDDAGAECFEVDISIARDRRGESLGAAMLRLACRHLAESVACACCVAYVKPDNEASLRVFVTAGFQVRGDVQRFDSRAMRLEWKSRR